MTDHHTYGTSSHTADELVRIVSDCLELDFAEHESDYLGIHYVAKGPDERIEVQPNQIPGDEDEDDLYAPEHPTIQALVMTTTAAPDPTLRARLSSIEGLTHLKHESL
ncbi:hypothetical protein SLINC_3281 [Streptomyces lincolnensis]|uniref:Uncharacterized protein n=1 Tax=Streptomyces lincolnensis TaxID=1915 RepID=A0A1B1MA41_STRLN|nr:hypothetical protein [Streptomyces lincolnensis]ANS65505.1 hypothetical protein SLINC_3281 [Streptomyces lincolnensis]AXG54731.1 hypothetical protein SLCG_3576 [Streptomyces lincolnensis]QMV09081.1 hypothetical protein GJU35_27870 [Streptomyces lincolnensis]